MKKLDNDNILVLALKLCLICFLMAMILAFLNSITAPRIEASKEQATLAELGNVISGAEFTKITDDVYKAEISGKTVGYAVKATTTKGYGGNIDMLVGLSEDFSVLGLSIIDDSETPGIGSRAMEKAFTDKFTGKKNTEIVKGSPSKENEVQAVSGATISSRAMNDGIFLATEILKEALK